MDFVLAKQSGAETANGTKPIDNGRLRLAPDEPRSSLSGYMAVTHAPDKYGRKCGRPRKCGMRGG
jgi:hypothetical protein